MFKYLNMFEIHPDFLILIRSEALLILSNAGRSRSVSTLILYFVTEGRGEKTIVIRRVLGIQGPELAFNQCNMLTLFSFSLTSISTFNLLFYTSMASIAF